MHARIGHGAALWAVADRASGRAATGTAGRCERSVMQGCAVWMAAEDSCCQLDDSSAGDAARSHVHVRRHCVALHTGATHQRPATVGTIGKGQAGYRAIGKSQGAAATARSRTLLMLGDSRLARMRMPPLAVAAAQLCWRCANFAVWIVWHSVALRGGRLESTSTHRHQGNCRAATCAHRRGFKAIRTDAPCVWSARCAAWLYPMPSAPSRRMRMRRAGKTPGGDGAPKRAALLSRNRWR